MTDVALELRALRQAVQAQADELAELLRCLLDKADRRTGQRLVPALGRLTQGQAFGAADVAALSLNGTTPAAGVLRDVIGDLADTDDGLRGFGRLLHRLRGVRFGALRLEPAGAGRWQVTGFEPK